MDKTILGTRVDPTSYEKATKQILSWAKAGESRYVCVANVHMIMEAYESLGFNKVVNQADLVTPDGMPLVWVLRIMGNHHQERVYGPGLLLSVAEGAARDNIPVGFIGGEPQVVTDLVTHIQNRFPNLNVVYSFSPPFKPVTPQEDQRIVDEINQSGARILFVGLGCPKQEHWMAKHRGKISSVMLGVGAAFDFHAGHKKQAPVWMQRSGLEWLFRLLQEPDRLWRRYLYHNPRFILLIAAQLIGLERYK
jgi:N-acetylglucosaminyldiphosphoundecaprenol N-acetyl-beta-D-mannosaminyltransferase